MTKDLTRSVKAAARLDEDMMRIANHKFTDDKIDLHQTKRKLEDVALESKVDKPFPKAFHLPLTALKQRI